MTRIRNNTELTRSEGDEKNEDEKKGRTVVRIS